VTDRSRGQDGRGDVLVELTRRFAEASGGRVLAVNAASWSSALAAAQVHLLEVGEPDAEELTFDAALIAGLSGGVLLDVIRAAAARVRPGGVVVLALPTERPRASGPRQLFGLLGRREGLSFEALCEAVLVAGLDEIEARELHDRAGTSVVSGRVRR
jgi:hypothetical protein